MSVKAITGNADAPIFFIVYSWDSQINTKPKNHSRYRARIIESCRKLGGSHENLFTWHIDLTQPLPKATAGSHITILLMTGHVSNVLYICELDVKCVEIFSFFRLVTPNVKLRIFSAWDRPRQRQTLRRI